MSIYSPLERIGDGYGNERLTTDVAEAIPFMQFAIAATSVPNNGTGRMPSHNPDHWLAVNNCGAASKALAVHLEKRGYITEPQRAMNTDHMLLQVDMEEPVWIEPTPLQFLSWYFIHAHNTERNRDLDDRSGDLLPVERVLIFPAAEVGAVAEWLSEAVHRYWQTKLLAFYSIAKTLTAPQLNYLGKITSQVPQAEIEADFAELYCVENFEPDTSFHNSDKHDMYLDLHAQWLETSHSQADVI